MTLRSRSNGYFQRFRRVRGGVGGCRGSESHVFPRWARAVSLEPSPVNHVGPSDCDGGSRGADGGLALLEPHGPRG